MLTTTFIRARHAIPATLKFIRLSSSCIVRNPSDSAPRIVPTPLVFVSATNWGLSTHRKGLSIFAELYATKGYTCLDVDLSVLPDPSSTSTRLMEVFESELHSIVRTSFIPFPPVFIARGAACLIAQTYISSHPASGLLLISPPPCNASVPEKLLPTSLPEFNFEPKFPICVMSTPEEMRILQDRNRLCKDQGVDKIVVGNVEGQEAFIKIEQWLDEIGI
ncbi:hypothetical protein K435DRAFT_758877 [Dendrothele bispora CBS 962.96]|uniref:Alpha/beta-hydrolase n=1 Tax=Dendrothele bispora (strain CBS 962.96) TaxID=1314807 RepID=A0A4S8LR90_DENBC|nr:hypothetical protein K435DRAFT_758877 [Dendrothele bispora CBS 962.96]